MGWPPDGAVPVPGADGALLVTVPPGKRPGDVFNVGMQIVTVPEGAVPGALISIARPNASSSCAQMERGDEVGTEVETGNEVGTVSESSMVFVADSDDDVDEH